MKLFKLTIFLFLLFSNISCQEHASTLQDGFYLYNSKLHGYTKPTFYKVDGDKIFKYKEVKAVDTLSKKELFTRILLLYNDYGRINEDYKLNQSNKGFVTFSHPEIDSLNPINTDLKFAEKEYAKGLSNEEVQKSIRFRKKYRKMTNQLKPGYIDTLWMITEKELINYQLNN